MERAFVANGSWQNAIRRDDAAALACDPAVQRKATLRVSALAALVTLGLTAGPDFRPDPALTEAPRRIAVAMPEIVTVKPADRVPSAGETTSAFQRRPRPTPDAAPVAEAPAVPPPGIEIVDAGTLKAGSMIVRIAGLAAPSATGPAAASTDSPFPASAGRRAISNCWCAAAPSPAIVRASPKTASRWGAAASARSTSPSRWSGRAGPRQRTGTSRPSSWRRRRPSGRSSASGATERRCLRHAQVVRRRVW